MGSRTSRSRPEPTRSNPPTSTSPRSSAASSWRSRSGLGDGRRGGHAAGQRAGAARRAGGVNIEGSRPGSTIPTRSSRIAGAPDDAVHDILAEAYQQPIREDLVAARIEAIHAGSKAAAAATSGVARRFGPFSAEQGADLLLVQSQVSSARHIATEYDPLSLAEFTCHMPIPVAVGNTTNAEAAFSLMEQGAAAVFVGVGPGAACTTREVPGIGVPQVTAISDGGRGARRLLR